MSSAGMEYYPNSTQLCLKVTSSSSTTSVTQLDWRRQRRRWMKIFYISTASKPKPFRAALLNSSILPSFPPSPFSATTSPSLLPCQFVESGLTPHLSFDNHINHMHKTSSIISVVLSNHLPPILLLRGLSTPLSSNPNPPALTGVPGKNLQRMHYVQNKAARVLIRVRKQYEHITPILYTLHWLPVHLHI